MDTQKLSSSFLTLIVPFLFFILFTTLPTTQASSTSSQLVENICKETINYLKCIEALEADPRTKSPKNLNAFAKDSIGLAIKNAKESLYFIHNLLKINKMTSSSSSGSTRRAVLKQCVASYKAVIGSFKSARTELSEDAMSANYDVMVAVDYIDSCESEMSLKNVQVLSMAERNNQVRLYSSIGYVITNKLD
ncbi:cell wall / vacuolar inhibitor of fructosidase 2-like [Cannabis sativa]|uniref:cell wall / vacuolar inhibitor of fructosidase 2-like n=1 Tax=Cannabis sativa TaxID=3483 RepID=UPI0029CA0B6F|nr:cell wall / vacuolar inhibitor of fructosidase 2-like [Cannabis sativa]